MIGAARINNVEERGIVDCVVIEPGVDRAWRVAGLATTTSLNLKANRDVICDVAGIVDGFVGGGGVLGIIRGNSLGASWTGYEVVGYLSIDHSFGVDAVVDAPGSDDVPIYHGPVGVEVDL